MHLGWLKRKICLLASAVAIVAAGAQSTLLPLPSPLGLPTPGSATASPDAPQPILPGGIVLPLYPAGSHFLNPGRARETEAVQHEPVGSGALVASLTYTIHPSKSIRWIGV